MTIDFYYEEANKGRFTPVARNIAIEHVTSQKAQWPLYLRGFQNAPIRDVSLSDCEFNGVDKTSVLEYVEGMSLRNVRVNGTVVEGM